MKFNVALGHLSVHKSTVKSPKDVYIKIDIKGLRNKYYKLSILN